MTMPSPAQTPPVRYPRIALMATDNIDGSAMPISWAIGELHPLDGGMRVVAMFINDDLVEVYSADPKGGGMRELVPLHRTRIIREIMPPDVFNDELGRAELGDDYIDEPDEEEELDDSPNPNPSPVSPTAS